MRITGKFIEYGPKTDEAIIELPLVDITKIKEGTKVLVEGTYYPYGVVTTYARDIVYVFSPPENQELKIDPQKNTGIATDKNTYPAIGKIPEEIKLPEKFQEDAMRFESYRIKDIYLKINALIDVVGEMKERGR